MTPERSARISQLIAEAETPEELTGLKRGLSQQGELTTDVLREIAQRMEAFS